MFLRATTRIKDGKEHRYWSIVENRRVDKRRTVQKTVLYLGELNDSQHESWCHAIEAVDGKQNKQICLFPSERVIPKDVENGISVDLSKLELSKPRQWGACWLSSVLWEQLELDEFWHKRLPPSRKGTRWLNVLKTLVTYRLIDPGSEWKLHRLWFDQSAMADILGESFQIAQKDTLYRCLDKLTEHKAGLFSHLKRKWEELFCAQFDVLLYDLTSTYFESVPKGEGGLRQFGYSRDKRSDCQQVVIALVVTTEGFPLTYEVMPGNTSDRTTLKGFLKSIESQYGQARRVWVMDRGVPTEEILQEMRESASKVDYLVGTPRGKLSALEKEFLDKPWKQVRTGVRVKLVEKDSELFILAMSDDRSLKESSMRRRKLKKLWSRLRQLQSMQLSHNDLVMKIGAAKKDAGRAYSLVDVDIPKTPADPSVGTFSFALNKEKVKQARRREGSYLLRSNCIGEAPEVLWQRYIQLTEVEQAFKELKGNLSIRPVYHQLDARIEAHIFVAFMAYCLLVTLKQRCKSLASGLTPRSAIEQMAGIQMLDVHIPTTDGRMVELTRYTQPDKTQQLLLVELELPTQPPPTIHSPLTHLHTTPCGEDLSKLH